jgi:hypothetical protein
MGMEQFNCQVKKKNYREVDAKNYGILECAP